MTAAQLEVVARAICLALGDDPEMLVVRGAPYLTRHGHAALQGALPNWQRYCYAARCAIEAMQAAPAADIDPLGR